MKNETIRIILRTGQPGQAPERRIIVDYDINDYKAKTELTADRLFTTLTASLRSYQQLHRLHQTRRGLEMIIEAASTLFDARSIQRLAEGVLTQIASLVDADCAGILVLGTAARTNASPCSPAPAATSGSAAARRPRPSTRSCSTTSAEAFERRRHEFLGRRSVLYLSTGSGREIVVLLEAARDLSDTDRTLVGVFCARLSIAFDNVLLYEQLHEANPRLEERVAKRTAELMSANRRLAAQSSELQRANRFKGEILGTIAHDLKNPLGVIMGRAEMLADLLAVEPGSPERIQAQIDHIRDSAKRLTGMVNALIADAMNDALDISIRREWVDLATLVADVAEANRPLADRKQPGRSRCRGPTASWSRATPTVCATPSTTSSATRSNTAPRRARSRSRWRARETRPPSASATAAPASRPRTWVACSAASSACPRSRPAARPRPGSGSRSPSGSSTCTAAG